MTEGEEHSSGPPVQGNIVVVVVHTGALDQVCALLVTKLVLCESQNPALLSAHLPEGCGLVQPYKDMGQVQCAAKKEAVTRSRSSVSFPICIVFCFTKLWTASEIPKCLLSVVIKPTLKKVKLSKLGHCSLGLDMILRALVDNSTDKY